MAGEFQAINLNVQNIDIDGVMECVADRLEVSNFIRSSSIQFLCMRQIIINVQYNII